MVVNWGIVGGISGIALIIVFLIIFFAYRKRSAPIMRLFGSDIFIFDIVNPARKVKRVNKIVKDFKIHGKVIIFEDSGQWYRVMQDRLILRNNIPYSLYNFGNPIPVNVLEHPEAEFIKYDENTKSNVKVKISGQELRDAIESKVVHDLNKFTFNRMEVIMIIIAIVGVIFNVVVLYEVVQVNSEFGTLINELNQILANLPHTTTTPPA